MLPNLNRHLLALALVMGISFSYAQDHTKCGLHDAKEELFEMFPEIEKEAIESTKELEEFTQNFVHKQSHSRSAAATKYIIPVVFHVLHQNGPENISDAQIHDAMRILNEDYSDAATHRHSSVVSTFQPAIGFPNIEFRLARKDPNGNPTTGIVRVSTNETNVGDQGSKLVSGWSRNMYLNIWVCKAINGDDSNFGTLAYSHYPGDMNSNQAAPFDGIITKQQFVGTIGTSVDPEGTTLTHEVGHYLNLIHVWGNSNDAELTTNCNDDDNVTDTPNTVGTLGGCNTAKVSCGSTDNEQNFMNYADCSLMFTQGQVNRMLATLNSTISQRSNLWSVANLDATGVTDLYEANFEVERYNACDGDLLEFYNASLYDSDDWAWTFNGATPSTSTDENPVVSYNQPGLYNVTLQAKKGTTQATKLLTDYIFVSSSVGKTVPATEDFATVSALPTAEWFSVNEDEDSYEFIVDATNGYNGGQCIRMDNYGNDVVTTDELISTTYDLSVLSDGEVSFKYAYKRNVPNDDDVMSLYLSDDCGATWVSIWSKTTGTLATVSGLNGTEFIPSGIADWRTETISNISSASLKEGVQFKFEFISDNGNDLYIDDFEINGTLNTLVQLVSPVDASNGLPNTTSLTWKEMANASSYEIEIDTDPNFNSGNLITGTSPTASFTPSSLSNGQTYYWRVRLLIGGSAQGWSDTWSFSISSDGVGINELLKDQFSFNLFPNPTTQNTVVRFDLQQESNTSMYLVDITGRTKVWFENRPLSQGTHVFTLNELRLSDGIYSLVLKIGEKTITERIIVK